MNRTQNRQHIEAIQVLRAVAALLVVLIHALDANDHRKDWARSWFGSIESLNNFGAIGVDVFFVLSGFVMAATVVRSDTLTWDRFLRDRFFRIMPFYWIATMAFLAVLLAIGKPPSDEAVLTSITLFPLFDPAVFTHPVLFVGWSLAFEMAFYLVVAALLAVPLPRRLLLPSLLCAASAMGVLGAVLAPAEDLLAFWLSPFWLEFAFGIAILMIWRSGGERIPRMAGLLSCGAAIAGLGHALLVNPPASIWLPMDIIDGGAGMLRIVWWGIPSASLVMAMLWWSNQPVPSARLSQSRIWQALLVLGDASFALYLVHPFVTHTGEMLLPTISSGVDLLILVEIGLSCGLALAAYRYIERPRLLARRTPPQVTGGDALQAQTA